MVTSTIQGLLDAATDALDGQSAAGLKVDDVARRAGINKRMIYHHFSNKAGLVAAVRHAQAALLCESGHVSETTRSILSKWYPGMGAGSAATSITAEADRRAARIVLAGLLEALGRGDEPFMDIHSAQWRVLLGELGGLACCGESLMPERVSGRSLSSEVTKREVAKKEAVKKEALKKEVKPSFRLASVSRPKAPEGS